MEHAFWHNIWATNEIGFHETNPNALLQSHLSTIAQSPHSRIFLPLCGKTGDIGWLLSLGYAVVGAELSELAIRQLFEELALTPEISEHGQLKRYAAEKLVIWVGDIFTLTAEQLDYVDAIYDRAAIVALPAEMRIAYSQHLITLTKHAPQLIVTYEYDQPDYPGPPFSISEQEIYAHYRNAYQITQLAHEKVPGGLKGLFPATTSAWQLLPS
ncbi:thiopurine S-methyltransferase [Thalassotalea euphylliae]|uniref:thiopurine S-methyltransferase n=1 Tax=Thalassotalea euphylliae TaxID=1655234 RepID=UPI003632D884